LKKNSHNKSVIEVVEIDGKMIRRHTRGCGCSNSGCSKRYCECFKFGVACTPRCKCKKCDNWNHCLPPGEREVSSVAAPVRKSERIGSDTKRRSAKGISKIRGERDQSPVDSSKIEVSEAGSSKLSK